MAKYLASVVGCVTLLDMWAELLGGLGFFLIGMTLMTEGLRKAAGDRFVRLLGKLTYNRFAAVATGVGITALLQSSSATTLTTIGLVSAGVMSFTAAVGVVFGANIGTTATSWLVATIGLKFKIAMYAYPMVGAGALASLVGRGASRDLGTSMAGFGMIFVGIDFLQQAMSGFSQTVDPAMVPSEGGQGIALMVILGLVMTVVMQSSSAAVATTLTALAAGTIGLQAAAAMVIGQNVGTTVTAAIGAIGATPAAKRTAVAHILFNLFTGLIALVLLPLFLAFAAEVEHDPAAQIAVFHTTFNVVGVLLFLPFIHPFCAMIERWVPDHRGQLTAGLDESALGVPAVALEATRKTCLDILQAGAELVQAGLETDRAHVHESFQNLKREFADLASFAARLTTQPDYAEQHARHISTVHAIDHLRRFLASADKPSLYRKSSDADVGGAVGRLKEMLRRVSKIDLAEPDLMANVAEDLDADSRFVARRRKHARAHVLAEAAANSVDAEDINTALRRISRVDRLAYHLSNCVQHLSDSGAESDIHEEE